MEQIIGIDLAKRVFQLLIQPKLPFVTTSAFSDIAYLRALHSEGKQVQAGFMVLNFIGLSMIVVNF